LLKNFIGFWIIFDLSGYFKALILSINKIKSLAKVPFPTVSPADEKLELGLIDSADGTY
jgi:hypothetical protein